MAARAPSDPYVLILEHTVPQPTDSPPPKGPRGSPAESRGHADEPRCVQHVSLGRACRLTPRFPPQGPPGRVPLLQRYYQGATTSCRPSRRTSLPSFGGTSRVHSLVSLPGGRVHRRGPELLTRSPARELAEEATGSRKFLGNPDCPFAHVQSTPAGLRSPDRCGGAAWPLVCEKQRLPRKVFRRSLAWLSDSLSTLRSAGYPRPTQDSLPAVGQTLVDGLCTRKVPLKSFRVVSLHLILLSQASWRNNIDRGNIRCHPVTRDTLIVS